MNDSEQRIDYPLVTFCFVTYNQEKYVAEALQSVLAQTYHPLEIVISDDASNDATWDIITKLVEDAKRTGCEHKIVLNRNTQNMGIARHWDYVESLCHGELKFMAAGDDISMPNRAEAVVNAWLAAKKTPAAVIHSGVLIDVSGKVVGKMRKHDLVSPIGAAIAWKRFPELNFPRIEGAAGVEDYIAGNRAVFLGGELIIPDLLIKYRVGSGLSSITTNQRAPALRGHRLWRDSFKQIYADLEVLRDRIGESEYIRMKQIREKEFHKASAYVTLLSSPELRLRISAWCELAKSGAGLKGNLLNSIYLLPASIGDVILNAYTVIKFHIRKIMAAVFMKKSQ